MGEALRKKRPSLFLIRNFQCNEIYTKQRTKLEDEGHKTKKAASQYYNKLMGLGWKCIIAKIKHNFSQLHNTFPATALNILLWRGLWKDVKVMLWFK